MPVRLCVGDPILVYINKEAKTQGIGLIKYIGFIAGHDMTEFVGIELLEQCDYGHNGVINGFQYFTAKAQHGIHVRICNIIRKLSATEVVMKMQEVIEIFKSKLDQYINAVTQRDSYIESLKQNRRDAKSLLTQAYDKIQSLKKEVFKLKNKNNATENRVVSKKRKHSPNSSHSNSSSLSLTNIVNIVNNAALEEGVETEINTAEVKEENCENVKKKKGKHGRNLSAQLKLDTIDDAYALMTPAADVPLLIEQMVQNMDNRRQSFNTVRTTSPITPMTPVTPNIDAANKNEKSTVLQHNDSDRFEYVSKSKKNGNYQRSFPDTLSPKSQTESVQTVSPSPSPKVHNNRHKHKKHKHLKQLSMGTEVTTDMDTPQTYGTYGTPETEFDESDESDIEGTQDEGDNTPYWSSSSNSEIEEESESTSNNTRQSYTFSSDSNDSNNETIATDTPQTHRRKRKKKVSRRKKKSYKKRESTNSHSHSRHSHTHKKHHKRSSVESPRNNGHKNNRRRSSKHNRHNQTIKEETTPVYNPNHNYVNNANANANMNGFPYSSHSLPSAQAHHSHHASVPTMHAPTMHAQRGRHSHDTPHQQQQSMAIAQPQNMQTNHNQTHANYHYMVPQLDAWDVLKQNTQRQRQQQINAQKLNSAQQITAINNIEQINIQNNPYLDQQYFYKKKQVSPQPQPHFNQNYYAPPTHSHIMGNNRPNTHKTYYSDSINNAAQQYHRKPESKSHKTYTNKRGGHKNKRHKNIQMLNISAKRNNNNNNIAYVSSDMY